MIKVTRLFLIIYSGIIKKALEKMEKYDLIMNKNEISLLNGITELLGVFNVFSTFIQGNDYPTLNTFVLFYAEIHDHLVNMHTMYDDEDDVIGQAAQILLDNLDKRLPLNEECIGAALIDPRMQRLPIIDKWLIEHGNWLIAFRLFPSINFATICMIMDHIYINVCYFSIHV